VEECSTSSNVEGRPERRDESIRQRRSPSCRCQCHPANARQIVCKASGSCTVRVRVASAMRCEEVSCNVKEQSIVCVHVTVVTAIINGVSFAEHASSTMGHYFAENWRTVKRRTGVRIGAAHSTALSPAILSAWCSGRMCRTVRRTTRRTVADPCDEHAPLIGHDLGPLTA
jgi:hypothetical protein